jgi:hypothetical protein
MKRTKKLLKIVINISFAAGLSVMLITGCMSPIYDTARTYPGWTVGGGAAFQQVQVESNVAGITEFNYNVTGIRPDISVAYSPTNTFSIVGRAGMLLNLASRDSLLLGMRFGGLGFKFSTPFERFNLGLRAEFPFPQFTVDSIIGVSFIPMAGLSDKTGFEYLTAGIQAIWLMPMSVFLNVHPFRGAHVFVGMGLPWFSHWYTSPGIPDFCLGIGYTHTFNIKE